MIITKDDFITGDKFIELADFTFAPNKRKDGDYDNLPNTYNPYAIKNGDIIYTHTIYAQELLDAVKRLDKQVILVTHNGDVNIDDSYEVPDNVIKWYSQNVNVMHDKIEPIPIGLENDRWFTDIHKKDKMIAKIQEPRTYKNILYMNHSVYTNPAKRLKPYTIFQGKRWVTTQWGKNGQMFDEYIDNIYRHKFVLCPEGNGIDTHRVWETLYLGSIPVVENNITNELLYTYFPTTTPYNGTLDADWSSLTREYLDREFKAITEIKSSTDIHNEMLTFGYWKNKIKNTWQH